MAALFTEPAHKTQEELDAEQYARIKEHEMIEEIKIKCRACNKNATCDTWCRSAMQIFNQMD